MKELWQEQPKELDNSSMANTVVAFVQFVATLFVVMVFVKTIVPIFLLFRMFVGL